ncbi:MAG TPA: dephospho-CoA kinase [Gammaproteobacteria bacterium]|nr:dephospho-CoA kinase [Xanthomonadales bacterium]MCB1595398.1 dephospho-CoA kinase [Xanthomonadales bacterium]HPI97044.1 dephospho-CoA kinase [Gammaproteobacteria bacterium]
MESKHNCFTVGLTGGIASGKSTVSDIFAELGCPIIDADIIAREVVEPKTEGLKQLVETFGTSILSSQNQLDRKKLRQIVFNDEEKRTQLNSTLHPLIGKEIANRVKQVKQSYCVVVIPLLCESSNYQWLDRILVVDVSEDTQIQRLTARDNITKELAVKMLASQCNRKQRLQIADDVINNEQDKSKLKDLIVTLDKLYKQLAIGNKKEPGINSGSGL